MAQQSNPRKVQKVGNSQGITLPADLLENAGLSIGDRVVVSEEEGTLTVEKVTWSTET